MSRCVEMTVSVAGIQFAGSHLQELQRAFKNPTAHLGLIFSEAGRRAGRAVGLHAPADISPLVAAPLRPAAKELARCVDAYGQAVEAALVRYGRAIVDEQFVLNRLASAAIDVYTTAVVLSRASRAARLSLASAAHELRLAEAWAHEALGRVPPLLAASRDPPALAHYARLAQLGRAVADHAGQPSRNPLDV